MSKMSIAGWFLCAIFVLAPFARAADPIARIPVEENPTDPAAKALVDPSRHPINLTVVSALSPPLAKVRGEVARAIRYQSIVARPLRELVILRTAQVTGGHYEIRQHAPAALTCGFSEAQVEGLERWQSGGLFDERERALLAYVDAVAGHKGEVDDATFAALERFFPPREIVEVTMIIAQYAGTAMLTNALRIAPDPEGRLASVVTGPC